MPRQSASHERRSRPEPRPWEWLYEVVGVGMWAVTRARFCVQVVGGPVPRVGRGQLWVATHRAETDVPLIGGLLTVRGGMWRRGAARMHFAARDDLFAQGVVSAGLRLPSLLARLAWPLTPGTWLPRVRAHPIRRPVGLKLSQALAGMDADVPLAGVLAPRIRARLDLRASQAGRPAPTTVRQARDPAFASELWQDVTDEDLCGSIGAGAWRAHVARAAGDLRRLIDIVSGGEPLLVFPEGRVSPDGGIGPVGEVLDLIVRRGAPASILPIAIAYDPLRRGRAIVAVSVGAPVSASASPVRPLMLESLRHATPVTVGQVVARELTAVAGGGATTVTRRRLLEAARATHDRARRDGRPCVRGLSSPGRRGRGVASALHALQARGLVTPTHDDAVRFDAGTVLGDPVIRRLAREDRAVWHDDAPTVDP